MCCHHGIRIRSNGTRSLSESFEYGSKYIKQQVKFIRNFTSVVCDLYPVPGVCDAEPSKESAAYYFRPWKTLLVRTVADGGESHYDRGDHADTIPAHWTALRDAQRLKRKGSWF